MYRLAALLLITAAGFQAQGYPEGVTAGMVEQGKSLYHGTGLCSACHGPSGQGGLGPSLSDTVWALGRGTYPELIERITRGVPADSSASGNMMPPLGGSALTALEVRMVAAYVWSLSHPVKGP